MNRSLIKFLICIMVSVPLPAFTCGLATPLCLAAGEAMLAWLTGGVVVATGALMLERAETYDLENLSASSFRGGTTGSFLLVFETIIENDEQLGLLNMELEINDIDGKFTRASDSDDAVTASFGPYDFKTCNEILNEKCEELAYVEGEEVIYYQNGPAQFYCSCVPIH